jgi:hypothetical protein
VQKKYVRRKNRKIKFSEDRYVEKYYMEDDKAVIPIELDNINDLYMKHDYKKMELSNSVCDYIEEIAYMVPVNVDIKLEIHCPKINISTQEKIKKNIRNNYGMEIDEIEYDIRSENKKSIILLIVGLLLLVINIITEKYVSSILSNFLCVVWWVAIWNVIEIQTMDKVESREQRLNYQQLYDSEITFVFDRNEKEN